MPPWMQEPADDTLYAEPAAHAPPGALTGAELVALQLLAAGYSPDQIAALRRGTALAVLSDLGGAVAVLGVANVRAAVFVARDRGLIV